MMKGEWIYEDRNQIRLHVYIQPKASRNKIDGIHDSALKIKITSPPVDGSANEMLIKLLSKELGIAKSDIRIISGFKARKKTLSVDRLSIDEIMSILGVNP